MEFRVPQFIEHDPKILGPFTVKQSVFIGGALGLAFLLYFSPLRANFFLYVLTCGAIFGVALMLAFVKIQGLAIPIVGKNFASFSIGSKIYKWKRKELPVFLSTTKDKEPELKANEIPKSPLKIKPDGKLGNFKKKLDFEK
ncbi:MAG: hypothetical protein PHG23_02310 [Candidatus Pacebacteria bacterium]|nr:hypothetical protein [Candidatus Paceibacterota bacterium]